MALGRDNGVRGAAHRERLQAAITDEEMTSIRKHFAQVRALASVLLRRMVEPARVGD